MKECYYMEDFRYLYNIAASNIEFDTVEDYEKITEVNQNGTLDQICKF